MGQRWKPIPGVIGPDRSQPGGPNKKVAAYPDHALREWLEGQVREGKKQDPNWTMSKQIVHLLRIARREIERPLTERVAGNADPFVDRVQAIMREHHVSKATAQSLARAETAAARRG